MHSCEVGVWLIFIKRNKLINEIAVVFSSFHVPETIYVISSFNIKKQSPRPSHFELTLFYIQKQPPEVFY